MKDSTALKTAVVTGAAGNIGQSIVNRLMEHEFRVIAVDLEFADEICDSPEIAYRQCDLCDERQRTALTQWLEEEGVDVLVNNAGISSAKRLHEISDEEWHRVMDINLNAVFSLSKQIIPIMNDSDYGSIINIGSIDGIGQNNNVAYATSKAALMRLTEIIAMSYGKHGITCNSVIPGLIETDMVHKYYDESSIAELASRIPVKRLGRCEEVASVVAFLCSQDARYINGSHIKVDGGYLL